MTLFDYICNNQSIAESLISYGVIPVDIEIKLQVYRRYLEYRQTEKRMQSIYNTAEDFKYGWRNVHLIVTYMERSV